MSNQTTLDLAKYWDKAVDYETYIENIKSEIEKRDSFENYYTLNLQRMDRLGKKLKWDQNQQNQLDKIQTPVDLLIITEGWCGDAAQIIPVIHKMSEASDMLQVRYIYRDENEDLINAYLTNGGKSIPIIIGLNHESKEQLFRWGPRPAFGNALLKKFKDGEMSKEKFQLDLQKAYNKDKGKTIFEEILNKII